MCRANRCLSLLLPGLALVAAGIMAPSIVQAAITFDGTYYPESSSWSSDLDGFIGTGGAGGTTTVGSGTVTVDAGSALNSKNGYLGYLATSFGSASVTGTSSTWSNASYLYVGYYGTGSLYLGGGGTVSNGGSGYISYQTGSAGTATVTGSGSTWSSGGYYFVVGRYGNGTLNIENGGTVLSQGTAYLASGTGSVANVKITGAGSSWSAGNSSRSYIGQSGTATMEIADGGNFSSMGSCYIGYNASAVGTVTVAGPGSTWTNTDMTTPPFMKGDLYVGYNGKGILKIENGGYVSTGNMTYVAYNGTNTGKIEFNGGTLSTKSLFANSSNLTGTGTIDTKGLVSNGTLTFNSTAISSYTINESVTADLDMSNSANVGDLGAGYDGNGILNIENGATVYSTKGYLGYLASAAGTATVSGGSWINSEEINIGHKGDGVLKIENGGAVTNGNSTIGSSYYEMGTGTVTVTGTNSTWTNHGQLMLGYNGEGMLKIENGGCVIVDGTTRVGNGGNEKGQIDFGAGGGTLSTGSLYARTPDLIGIGTINTHGLVSDKSLTFDGTAICSVTFGTNIATTVTADNSSDAGDLGVGYVDTTATLTIKNGATVYSANGSFASNAFSKGVGTVTENSKWVNSGTLYVGRGGEGTLDITSGGTVSSVGGYIGYNSTTGWGQATVDGGGSTWSSTSKIYVGYLGTGILHIKNGGAVIGSIAIASGWSGTGIGELSFDNGTLKANAANANWISLGSGLGDVYIEDGGATFDTNGYDMGISVLLDGSGTNGGITKIGDGTLTLSGANTYTGLTSVDAGTLKLVDATSGWTDAFEPIFTGGSASIGGGTLLFNYSDTYDDATALSNVQAAITAGRIFAAYHTPPLLCSGNTATDTVSVLNTLFGDSNVDGSVNGTDLNAVLSYYNQSGQIWANGDFNFDGSVNGTDLNTVLSNYNQSVSFASTAAVPEPSTLLLMVLGLVGLLAWRKLR